MNIKLSSHLKPQRVAALAAVLALTLAGCGTSTESIDETNETSATADAEPVASDDSPAEAPETRVQDETCDWDSPKISGTGTAPSGQNGELAEVLVGSWQHTHSNTGNGFEATTYDHRYVFPSPDRVLYCQHVPGATNHAENAGDITLNGTVIELPGGQISYTVTAWDEDTLTWNNPVGGGSVYLLQRR